MGALAHHLEEAGLATTHISLVREHTEAIRPPRALWVPFELGRPFGVPDNPEFQMRVLLGALNLLEAGSGPVLADFPEEAPASSSEAVLPACPVSFPQPEEQLSPIERLLADFRAEALQMRTWFDLARERKGRTTSGTTGHELEETVDFLAGFVRGSRYDNWLPGQSQATALKLAVEDVKAAYFEALAIQPGQTTDSSALADWFWGRTFAAKVINEMKKICLAAEDEAMKKLGVLMLVPRVQTHRFEN